MSAPKTLEQAVVSCSELFQQHELFYGHGTDNPLDEAIFLVLGVANIFPFSLNIDWNQKLDESQLLQIDATAKARIYSRKPLSYLNNIAYFANYKFYVDCSCLIPRSPIGELIANHYQPFLKLQNFYNALDMCSGSGCIGIATALYHDWLKVDLVDIDKSCLEVAKKNVDYYNLGDRVSIYRSDMFNDLHFAQNVTHKKYDVIVSNPPYVAEDELLTLPKEYSYEPKLGLLAEKNGLEFINQLILNSANYLTDNGLLFVEVGSAMDSVCANYPDLAFEWLEFENGGEGVFLLTKSELEKYTKQKIFNHGIS